MATIGVTRARVARPVIVALVMLGLAAALSLTAGAARPVPATPPTERAAADSLAVVRGGIATALVPDEPLAVAGDVVATIAVRTAPQARHARTLVVTLASSAGAVDGGAILVSAHMRYMDHGSFATRAVAEGGGRYVAALPFAMPGEWELVVMCQAGRDSAELVVDVTVFD
jgi:hypothetical protein